MRLRALSYSVCTMHVLDPFNLNFSFKFVVLSLFLFYVLITLLDFWILIVRPGINFDQLERNRNRACCLVDWPSFAFREN